MAVGTRSVRNGEGYATGSSNSYTFVSVVMPLATTEAIALKRKQFSTRLRTVSLTRIVVPYSLFKLSRRAAKFTLLPSAVYSMRSAEPMLPTTASPE